MGYMSEVVFAIEADAVPTMLAWCEKHPALKQLLFVQTDTRHLGDYDDAGSYLFHWGLDQVVTIQPRHRKVH